MKLFLAMLLSVFVIAPLASAKSYVDDSEIFDVEEPLQAEIDDTESKEMSVDLEEIEIIDSEDEYLNWMDAVKEDSAETVYIDEEGNEYYVDETEEANSSPKSSVKLKKKKKNKKSGGRNCVAQSGGASWYGPGFHGRKTANGERFNQNALTAAHKTLKFGSKVRVTYKGRSVVVRINDAGPYVGGRVIDLSKAAAASIGLIGAGHGRVTLEVISCG